MMSQNHAQPGAKPTNGAGVSTSSNSNTTNASSGERLLDILLYSLIPGLVLVHLIVAPYTKVEESFNIQAAHDVLVYGTPTSDIYQKLSSTYDHFTFPGAVPRTFVGPVLLAGFAQPIVALVGFQHAQFVVRAILGVFNATCLLILARDLRRAYGPGTARWYLLLQASQFHIIFYASRTLPNMFAFGLTTLSTALLLPTPTTPSLTAPRQRLAIALFVFAAVIFRSEVALLLATTVLHQLLIPALSLERAVLPFLASFLIALLISVPVDSYFWQRPSFPFLWPELAAFWYNVVQGGASNWGVEPVWWYLTSAVPRLVVNPLVYVVLLPVALLQPALRRAAGRLVVPAAGFVALYSLQPHKETRFVFYVVPALTGAAALGADYLFARRGKSLVAFLLAVALVLSVLASFAASTAMLAVSALNYPGGEALAHLRSAILSSEAGPAGAQGVAMTAIVPVHADVLSCMTGVTLFGTSTASSIVEAGAIGFAESGSRSRSTSGLGWLDSDAERGAARGETVKMKGGKPHGVRIAVDKTEDPSLLANPDFWRQFTYLLVEDRSKVVGGDWETVGVVKGYGGIELVKPGQAEDYSEGKGAPPVVGRGQTVEKWKRKVRSVTGGWWIGPRMVERVYILRRVMDGKRGVAVEAK
ncbi:hypothetical protein VTI74DRAFT_4515 [Chaetomium olivicolor]